MCVGEKVGRFFSLLAVFLLLPAVPLAAQTSVGESGTRLTLTLEETIATAQDQSPAALLAKHYFLTSYWEWRCGLQGDLGRTTMNAYDRIYLEDAMHNLGVMVDCGVNILGCAPGDLWDRFLASSIADRFSRGAVDIVAGHSGVELAMMVMRETGREIYECSPDVSISSPEYWAGMTIARYQWESSLTFKEMSIRIYG